MDCQLRTCPTICIKATYSFAPKATSYSTTSGFIIKLYWLGFILNIVSRISSRKFTKLFKYFRQNEFAFLILSLPPQSKYFVTSSTFKSGVYSSKHIIFMINIFCVFGKFLKPICLHSLLKRKCIIVSKTECLYKKNWYYTIFINYIYSEDLYRILSVSVFFTQIC